MNKAVSNVFEEKKSWKKSVKQDSCEYNGKAMEELRGIKLMHWRLIPPEQVCLSSRSVEISHFT